MDLEYVRQQCIRLKEAAKIWKKKTPKGKKYVGYKFVPYRNKSKEGWVEMGFKVKPVYKKR